MSNPAKWRKRLSEKSKECEHCGSEYTPNSYTQKWCSEECREAARSGHNRSTERTTGYLYAARDVEQPTRIKIGVALEPEDRLMRLQADAELLCKVETYDRYGAESELHDRLSDFHVEGEWFQGLDTDRLRWAMADVVRDEEDVGGQKEPNVLGTREVAQHLGCTPSEVREAIHNGDLEGQKWSGKWVITEDALREWLPQAVYERHFAEGEKA